MPVSSCPSPSHGHYLIPSPDLRDGVEKYKCTDVVEELGEEWAGLSSTQKKERTKQYIEEIEMERESRMYGEQNGGLAAFVDMRVAAGSMAVEVR